MPNTFQEKLLLYRIRAKRDPDAFGRLYDAYVKRIYRFVYFKLQSTEEAQDVTSEVFLKLWQYLQTENKVSHLGALLYQISRNAIIDHRRKMRPEARIDASEQLLDMPDISGLANIYRSAELSQVLTAVKLLKDEYREVLTMRYIDGIPPTEIAALLGKKPGHVRVLLHRALETVRVLLTSPSGR
jgi:RNA polymerase sigma factor (sigma-70 family)